MCVDFAIWQCHLQIVCFYKRVYSTVECRVKSVLLFNTKLLRRKLETWELHYTVHSDKISTYVLLPEVAYADVTLRDKLSQNSLMVHSLIYYL